ncbi:hypothetical protein BJ741DRAFT_582619 [Chytriomyces cf. hyalinus JEL632]|nr:hypothetical protein BJ741DRAFT_582619 [Chytriomyces cf. hyalinus JEL632]
MGKQGLCWLIHLLPWQTSSSLTGRSNIEADCTALTVRQWYSKIPVSIAKFKHPIRNIGQGAVLNDKGGIEAGPFDQLDLDHEARAIHAGSDQLTFYGKTYDASPERSEGFCVLCGTLVNVKAFSIGRTTIMEEWVGDVLGPHVKEITRDDEDSLVDVDSGVIEREDTMMDCVMN